MPASNLSDSERTLLVDGLEELELRASPAQLDALLALARLLETWSKRINLTGDRTLRAILRHRVLGAAALLAHAPPFASLADLGSGAGFPGLPVAVLRPDTQVTLIESRQKRHHFQRAAIRELGLSNATARLGRAEALTAQDHQAVIAQAMARPAGALGHMLRWAEPGGWLLLPGSADPPVVPEDPAYSCSERVCYRAPGGGPARSLWIGRKRSD
jgi:16S rRNA (guanine527-N7)-methyltransferase